MSFWCLHFLQEMNESKSTIKSSKVEFVRSFFGRSIGLKKSFRICLTFNKEQKFEVTFEFLQPLQFQVNFDQILAHVLIMKKHSFILSNLYIMITFVIVCISRITLS